MPSAFDSLMNMGRSPSLVNRKTLLVRVSGVGEFGPLPERLAGYQVEVEVRDGTVNVYYNRDLLARFSRENEPLPLHDDALTD